MTLPAPFDKLRLPVIGSPLFIVSGPELVIAQCKAGIIGSFPALNARPQTQVDEWLHQITEELAAHNRDNPDRPAAPYAVNQIVHKSNDRLEADMATCAKWQVPLVITSLGAREEVFSAVKGWGGISMHDVINDRFARKAIEKGASGLIPVAAGAGGHAGVLSPFALMQEIREWFDGLVALSGSIAHGRSILAAQALGANFAYIGSPWIAATEANADERYKQAIVQGRAASDSSPDELGEWERLFANRPPPARQFLSPKIYDGTEADPPMDKKAIEQWQRLFEKNEHEEPNDQG